MYKRQIGSGRLAKDRERPAPLKKSVDSQSVATLLDLMSASLGQEVGLPLKGGWPIPCLLCLCQSKQHRPKPYLVRCGLHPPTKDPRTFSGGWLAKGRERSTPLEKSLDSQSLATLPDLMQASLGQELGLPLKRGWPISCHVCLCQGKRHRPKSYLVRCGLHPQ